MKKRHFSPIRQRSTPVASVHQWNVSRLYPDTFATKPAARIIEVDLDARGRVILPKSKKGR